jgi:hypothetical protein
MQSSTSRFPKKQVQSLHFHCTRALSGLFVSFVSPPSFRSRFLFLFVTIAFARPLHFSRFSGFLCEASVLSVLSDIPGQPVLHLSPPILLFVSYVHITSIVPVLLSRLCRLAIPKAGRDPELVETLGKLDYDTNQVLPACSFFEGKGGRMASGHRRQK